MKFKHGEKVTHNGEERTILIAQKNFANGAIKYKLDNNSIVPEEELEKKLSRKVQQINPGLKEATERYIEIFEKGVPNNKKNDLEWIQQKIQEHEGGSDDAYETLSKLDKDQLLALIEQKGIEIDAEDYETQEELLVAVCEEMDVTIPEAE